jgi:hypothetical protein
MASFEYKKWSVSRRDKEPLLLFIVDGLKAAGCTVLFTSEATHAPFLITYETPAGERQGVLVYAFFANSKVTENRPDDEHRFQIKYGKKQPGVLLQIEQDPSRILTTLFVGIDTERGILVGADPVLHDRTKMFISLEFKRHCVVEIQTKGWHAWERDRRSPKKPDEDEPLLEEVLVGVRKERVLDFIQFERLALGLDAGHRQLLAEQLLGASPVAAAAKKKTHALANELGLPSDSILDLIQATGRLKMAVRGWVAEVHLENFLKDVPGVQDCHRIDGEGQPDIELRFRGSKPILIECKNVLRKTTKVGEPRVDFQRTRASKSDPCSRYYQPTDFTILAACLHAVTEQWDYRFALTRDLPAHNSCCGRISNNIRVGVSWYTDPEAVLHAATLVL